MVGIADDEYPVALGTISAPPSQLWFRGSLPPPGVVAVVGTRQPSGFGRRVADVVARSAVEAGLGVIAGLATGVDAVAHRSAIDAGGRTWAVLGSGVDRPSPASNVALAEAIVESGGGLIAEVPPGTASSARWLVARDRIQSGLSLAVVLCQCDVGSGAMHTARFAVLQGRPLVVVRPRGRDAALPTSAGNLVLCDAAGCDPALLSATGSAAAAIRARRPVADVVIDRREELPELWTLIRARSAGFGPPWRSSPAARPARPERGRRQ